VLKTPSMRALLVLAIVAGTAHADPERGGVDLPDELRCSALGCGRSVGPGGQATSRVRVQVGPRTALVGVVATAERPIGSMLASQAIIALGERRRIGRGWLELGFGLAASQVAASSVDVGHVLDGSRPAVIAGAGTTLVRLSSGELAVSIAAGSSSDARLYQVTTGFEAHWL